ncbi:MAG: 5-formyltetrahydrofolate cyclo-ligase [Gammaproteobacteria bacterium RIFCSPHIGHO2_12_FULL_41_15]|nr:MAG: 5-formyltetrahydrofolate cyclo-ligase [Gammaproteobacteria bacterium RIFCSPHIGHO2_12_FULL_41_15]
MNAQKQALRKILRQRRTNLSDIDRKNFSLDIAKKLYEQKSWQIATKIGFFFSQHSEVQTASIIKHGLEQNKLCYLPVLSEQQITFHAYRSGETLIKNRFNISEPNALTAPKINPNELDIILMPLIGFDERCNRLGQGGGYYDRCLQDLKNRRPILIGLAFECQKTGSIPTESWDIPVNYIITEQNLYAL